MTIQMVDLLGHIEWQLVNMYYIDHKN